MSSLSIRKLPRELEEALKRETRASGRTKTQVVIEALERRFFAASPLKKRQQLRSFFGKMTTSELESFQSATADFEKIDESMWR